VAGRSAAASEFFYFFFFWKFLHQKTHLLLLCPDLHSKMRKTYSNFLDLQNKETDKTTFTCFHFRFWLRICLWLACSFFALFCSYLSPVRKWLNVWTKMVYAWCEADYSKFVVADTNHSFGSWWNSSLESAGCVICFPGLDITVLSKNFWRLSLNTVR